MPTAAGLYDKGESMWKLGVRDHRTLDRWVAAAALTYQDDPADAKRKLLTEAQLRRLARDHRRTLRDGEPPGRLTRQAQRERLPTRLAALEQRLGEVEAAVAASRTAWEPMLAELLREHDEMLAILRELATRGVGRPRQARQEGRETGGEGEGGSPQGYGRAGRVTRPLSAQERLGIPPLPGGWMSVSTWAKAHGLTDYSRSVTRAIHETQDPALRLPMSTAGLYVGPTGQIAHEAYDPEQHVAASKKARQKWPDHFHPCPLCEGLL